MASPSVPQATRRRRRSTRLTVAAGLLVIAALIVVGAALSGSWLLATVAAGLGVVLGTAATRITHTELVDSRVVAARDRADLARDYNVLADERATEHSSYVAHVHDRLTEREMALDELEAALAAAQGRAAMSTRRRYAEGRRAAGLQVALTEAEGQASVAALRISELEQEVLALRAELDTVSSAWRAQELQRRHA